MRGLPICKTSGTHVSGMFRAKSDDSGIPIVREAQVGSMAAQ